MELIIVNYILYGNGKPIRGIYGTSIQLVRTCGNYQEGSVHTIHTSRSGFRRKSHISHERDDNKAMQREIDNLKKQLRQAQQKRSSSNSDVSSNDEEDTMYR